MANPNVFVATSMQGKTAYSNVTTALANVVVNPSSSGKSLRIVNLSLAGVDTVVSPNVTVGVVRNGITNYIVANITIPVKSTVIILGKENLLFLEEGDDLRIQASANSLCWATVAYEEIF
jgi:hypothetical protein